MFTKRAGFGAPALFPKASPGLPSGCWWQVLPNFAAPVHPCRRTRESGGMDEDVVTQLSLRHGGLIPARDLLERGINAHAARRLVERGVLVRIRRGVYADASGWPHGTAKQAEVNHRLLVRAVARCAERPMLVSHMSAAALHGLPVIGGWPETVHVITADATGGSTSRYITSHRGVAPPQPVQIGELAVTSLERTLVDVATTSSFLAAVTMIDHALRVESERVEAAARRGLQLVPRLTRGSLLNELAAVDPRRGRKQAERAIAFANPLAANPGESLSRVRIFELGFEVPELQVSFPNIEGHDYWVDFYWRGIRKIGEFDGMVKYTRGAVLGDRDPVDVVVAEKLREDALRRRVNSFSRWIWDTAISPRKFYDFLVAEGVPRA
ncbi:type IV toxin-antitoxin system AbiEi family antitoxin domain-containing protein [Cryobacterium tepidiphilum]|uniref:AbiEi antitoxin N-terminal domain-containing protein n=1 Tax=Cryobacterium tepidiphilum TaxID=2486026 RepID=A0A3M8LBZ1_9MICO|nr:type IV toxin-antitoxin system AbiEi family antitoxin domain-containing protein [Cryobacterium tepidiphilum]RNE62184.1 hypothetical protein EEJ31_08850 [Cryobacterium tepidiphilum]